MCEQFGGLAQSLINHRRERDMEKKYVFVFVFFPLTFLYEEIGIKVNILHRGCEEKSESCQLENSFVGIFLCKCLQHGHRNGFIYSYVIFDHIARTMSSVCVCHLFVTMRT